MKFSLNTNPIVDITSDALIISCYQDALSDAAIQINTQVDNHLQNILDTGDLQKTGASITLHNLPGVSAKRVILINLGKKEDLTLVNIKQNVNALIATLATTNVSSIHLAIDDSGIEQLPSHLAYTIAAAAYQCDYLKTKTKANAHQITEVSFTAQDAANTEKLLEQATAINQAMLLTKKLADLPGNICNPSYMAEQAVELGKQHASLTVDVQSEEDIIKHGMGAFASVSRGSIQDAKLVTIEYQGASPDEKPYVIVGKGVTFDTGGISIKPSQSMEEMKYDMCGAASVLGIMKAVAILKLPINLVGVMGCTENMPGGNASKPGDIVTTMSGQTVEVINTDAEGRLVLCDCLTYVKKYQPKAVIDMATLTGACVIALGNTATGLYANQHADYPELGQDLQNAADESGDKAWLMPLWAEYHDDLHSNFADMANCGPRGGAGSISAACFLEKFVDYPWAHLDIAGTAWTSEKNIKATGRPVPMIMKYLLSR